jgi:hypothetical protein
LVRRYRADVVAKGLEEGKVRGHALGLRGAASEHRCAVRHFETREIIE